MIDHKGCKCVSCHKPLRDGDDIVVCPDCGAPYHRACYEKEGACLLRAKHGNGFEYVPPEAAPDTNADGPVCPACHAQNPADAIFCNRCGKPLRGGAYAAAPGEARPGAGAGVPGSAGGMGGFGGPAGPGAQYAAGDVLGRLNLAGEYDGIPTADWMTYIGNSAPYYLYQFQRMDESGRKTSFCWSALFVPEFYFLYRRMWGWGALALGLSLLLSVPSFLALAAELGVAALAAPVQSTAFSALLSACGILSWALRILSCLFGFYLFRRDAARRIGAMRSENADDGAFRAALRRSSGPSRVAAVLVAVLLFACSLAFYAWVGPDRLLSAFYLV